MGRRQGREFYLVVVDDDQKLFNIVGPMVNDSASNKKVAELREAGRNVRCFSTSIERTIEQIADVYSRQEGFSYTRTNLIDVPDSTEAEYRGLLPKYAENANRARLVQLLCKGLNPHTAWAEMNVDYPGQEQLRRSGVSDYTATCLKCGRVARDPYNWYR